MHAKYGVLTQCKVYELTVVKFGKGKSLRSEVFGPRFTAAGISGRQAKIQRLPLSCALAFPLSPTLCVIGEFEASDSVFDGATTKLSQYTAAIVLPFCFV